MAHAFNSSYLGSRIMVPGKPREKIESIPKTIWAWWFPPVISDDQKAEVIGSQF
jgi:hypothetical protein